MAQVNIFRDQAGYWRWRLVAGNGEIVATGEAYTRRHDAQRGFDDAKEAFTDVLTFGNLPVGG